jgi:hypothetical protein
VRYNDVLNYNLHNWHFNEEHDLGDSSILFSLGILLPLGRYSVSTQPDCHSLFFTEMEEKKEEGLPCIRISLDKRLDCSASGPSSVCRDTLFVCCIVAVLEIQDASSARSRGSKSYNTVYLRGSLRRRIDSCLEGIVSPVSSSFSS